MENLEQGRQTYVVLRFLDGALVGKYCSGDNLWVTTDISTDVFINKNRDYYAHSRIRTRYKTFRLETNVKILSEKDSYYIPLYESWDDGWTFKTPIQELDICESQDEHHSEILEPLNEAQLKNHNSTSTDEKLWEPIPPQSNMCCNCGTNCNTTPILSTQNIRDQGNTNSTPETELNKLFANLAESIKEPGKKKKIIFFYYSE